MVKKLEYATCKYMDEKIFIDFCKENSVKIDSEHLEYFEKIKLFHSIKRLVYPEEYAILRKYQVLTLCGKQPDRITSKKFMLAHKEENNSKYISFVELEEKINSTHISLLELEEEMLKFRNLSLFGKIEHPFDEKDKEWQRYIINQINNEYIDCKDYYRVNYKDENGENLHTSQTKNYYSYWQIYELDGINHFRKGSFYNIHFNQEENYYHLKCYNEKLENFTQSNKNKILRIFQLEHYFYCLCEFIQFRERSIITLQMEKRFKGLDDVLTEEERESLEIKLITKSNQLMDFYNFSVDDLYEFIKQLCKFYFFYEDEEKPKLQNLIKIDIWYCIRLILYLTPDTWENVSLKIGRHGQRAIYYRPYSKTEKNTLEVIFPNQKEEIKEEAMFHIDIQLKDYNKQINQEYQLSEDDIKSFVGFIETNELDHFLIFMADINKDYFSNEYKSGKNITFHLRNLSIFVEEIVKKIGLNSIPSIKEQYSTNKTGFRFLLSPLCQRETWWGMYCDLLNSKETDIYNFSDKIYQVTQDIDKKRLDKQRKFILINLLRASIIRNYYAHNSAQMNNFKSNYPLLFESLIYSIFIIWAIGKDKIINELTF